jgi:hypothetical protein
MTTTLNEIRACEVCGNRDLSSVLDLGSHPMCDDLVPVGQNRVCREYPIEILFCAICVTAHQRFQVPKTDLFPASYHYRSRFTADVLQGMANLVDSCRVKFGDLDGKVVLDIGCNDGSLLTVFRKQGAVTIGLEPTDAALDAQAQGHVVLQDYLSETVADQIVASYGKPDFVVFTNVFAHIENLRGVVAALRRLMREETVLVIENHYFGAVLDHKQFDTFYHEHPRTYSLTSFVHIAKLLEVAVASVEFPSRYGGNIRVFLSANTNARLDSKDIDVVLLREQRFREQFNKLRKNVEEWRAKKGLAIQDEVRRHGKLRAKAFPGRAAILIKLMGFDENVISAVYEKPGSMKVGNYVPGTRIPILSDDELWSEADRSKPILNLAWHIPQEIREYLGAHDYTGRVIDIIDSSDFAA